MSESIRKDSDLHQASPTQVEAALARLFSAHPFRDAPQLRSFLGFVVKEALEGRGNDIKGYSIATLALGRPESFDPQTDPIVRVQAGRVRQALAEFYSDNPDESVIVSLERGSYVPQFSLRTDVGVSAEVGSVAMLTDSTSDAVAPAQLPKAKAVRPSIAWFKPLALVLGLFLAATAGWWAFRKQPDQARPVYSSYVPSLTVEIDGQTRSSDLASIAERTRAAIARFDDVVVVQDNPDMAPALPERGQTRVGIRLVLRISGAAAGPDQSRILARLVDPREQTLVWSREFDPFPSGPSGDDQRSNIVKATATAIAQPYGVIHAYVRSLIKTARINGDPYGCVVASFDYWLSNDRKRHLEVRNCITQRLVDYPNAAPMHAQMTYIHLEEYRQGYNQIPGDPLERALLSAQRAVQLAPTSARAYQALIAAHFARKEMHLAWRAASDALLLNPYDTEIQADIGARHVQSGNYEKGLGLLTEALALNTSPPTWATTFRVIALYMLGRVADSSSLALTLQGSDYPLALVGIVMGHVQLRDLPKARAAMNILQTKHPEIQADLFAYLKKLSFDDQTARQISHDFDRSKIWLKAGGP
ncbi:MAG: tetratricopeptide repeat protein [Beijerinckiaceae bacterium]